MVERGYSYEKNSKKQCVWVGKIDWELQRFHGYELSTHKGSTYNSYLIEEEKTFLVDTVWLPSPKEFVDNLSSEIDLKKIDAIVVNHGEVDHSGALSALMAAFPKPPFTVQPMPSSLSKASTMPIGIFMW